jgi:homoserine O-acetyltransferase
LIGRLNLWMAPIVNDPNWNGGDYYGRTPPNKGVAEALKQITLDARHWGWAGKNFGRKWAAEGRNPLDGWDNKYLIEDTLDKVGADRAAIADANALLYLARANQLYQVDPKAIKAKVLFVPAKSDLLLHPAYGLRAAEVLKMQGNTVEVAEIDGDGGHLDGVFLIGKVGEQIRTFLAR